MVLNLLAPSIDGTDLVLIIAIIIISILIGIAAIAATVLRTIIFFQYWVTNRKKTEGGYNGQSAAYKLLHELGFDDVQVKKCGIFRALIYGNHYNPTHKTVYLLRSALEGEHLTAIGIALQKVGLVIQDKRDSAAFKARWRLQQIGLFGPILFIPLVLVGVILDLVMLFATGGTFTGIFTLITAILAFALFIVCFVLSFLTMKVEGRANRETLEILKNHDFLTPDEQQKVAKVFRTYQLAYITDFLINLLQLIRLVLKILLAANQNKK